MGGACSCCAAELEFNPDGTQKPAQTTDQIKNDGVELRRAAKDADIEAMHTLVRRMPRAQITEGAHVKQVASPEEEGNTALHFCALNNHLRGVKKLVLYGHGLNAANAAGLTPLHLAIAAGKRKVSHFLLSRGANVNARDKQGATPLMTAFLAADKSIVTWLLTWTPKSVVPGIAAGDGLIGVGVEGPVESTLAWDYTVLDGAGVSYLTIAARMGWWDLVRDLVGKAAKALAPGPDGVANPALPKLLNARSTDGETVLGWVLKYAIAGNMEGSEVLGLVKLLLEHGASASVPCFAESVPPLLLATATGNLEVFDAVLQAAGPDAVGTARDGLQRTALHYAAAKGHDELVTLLLGKGLQASAPDLHKDTPLALAAMRGHADVARELLTSTESQPGGKVAAVTMPNLEGKAVYHLALGGGCGPKAQEAALNLVALLAEQAPDKLKLPLTNGDTPLLLAVKSHQHATVKSLIGHGADVNEANVLLNTTPLTACLSSVTKDTAALDAGVLKLLLDAGATVDVPNPSNHPLLALCKNDVNSFAELALDCLKPKLGGKAPWDSLKDDQGRTPLHLAALHNNAFLVRVIADEHAALLHVRCTRGYTPLDWAAVSCSADAVKLLINRGANVKGGSDGPSPLKLTLTLDKQESLTCAALLLRSGAPTEDCVDLQGEGLLHRAVKYGSSDFIRLWFKHGGNMALAATTPNHAEAVPVSLALYEEQLAAAVPGKKAGSGAKAGATGANKVDLLDEVEEAVAEMDPEDEEGEESDGEEAECKRKVEESGKKGAVAEGVEDWWSDGDVRAPWREVSSYSGPSRTQRRQWRKAGSKWWDSWLDDVPRHQAAGNDWQLVRDQGTNNTSVMLEDEAMESKDGAMDYDDLIWEVLAQKNPPRTRAEAGPIAEGLMSAMSKSMTNKIHPLGEEGGAPPSYDNYNIDYAMKTASELLSKQYAELKIQQSDPFHIPGESLFEGDPACMKVDTVPCKPESLDSLADQLLKRVQDYTDRPDAALEGAELRERNIMYWLKSLSPGEFPMKVGAWSKVPSLTAAAIREARARTGKPGTTKERKRTAMIGLPDLPTAPELELTTPLIYAVRLARVPCVRALLECSAAGVDKRDLWGHSALDYAMFLLFKDKRNPDLAIIADRLLAARASVGVAAHDTVNALHPLALAVMANDLSRVAWMVRRCGGKLDVPCYLLTDAPAHLEGLWQAQVGSTEARVTPLHLAVLTKKEETVRLVLDMAANPNRHAWGFEGPVPYKLRESFLSKLSDARNSGKGIDNLLEERKSWVATERAKAKQFIANKKKGKKNALMELAKRGAAFGGKALGGAAMGVMSVITSLKDIISEILGGPDPWVSPLHLACRYGLTTQTVLLLSRGAAANGGAAAALARRSPMEEALKYARDNFTYDNVDANRHNWEAIRQRGEDLPGYSDEAAKAKSEAAMMSAAMMMMGAGGMGLMMKPIIMAAKFVIDLILSSMKRAIAHFDPAMFCAHVMLRNFAPLKPSETQTAALLRDLQDNGTWLYVSPKMKIVDKQWLDTSNNLLKDLLGNSKSEFSKIGKTADYKEHDKLVKKLKRTLERRYVASGSKVFMDLYNKESKAKSAELATKLKGFAQEAKKMILDNSKAAVVGKLAIQSMYSTTLKQARAERAAAPKPVGAVWDEASILGTGETLEMPGFDTTDAKSFLGASFQALSMTRGMSGSGAAGGLQSGASMSRAKSLNLARARSAKSSSGAMGMSGRLGSIANGTPFDVPKTLEETTAAATAVLGCVDAAPAAERFVAALTSEVGEGQLSAKLDAMIKQAEDAAKAFEAESKGSAAPVAKDAAPGMLEKALLKAKKLSKKKDDDEEDADEDDEEGGGGDGDGDGGIEEHLDGLVEDIDADVDGLLDQAEEMMEVIQELMEFMG